MEKTFNEIETKTIEKVSRDAMLGLMAGIVAWMGIRNMPVEDSGDIGEFMMRNESESNAIGLGAMMGAIFSNPDIYKLIDESDLDAKMRIVEEIGKYWNDDEFLDEVSCAMDLAIEKYNE